MEVQTLVVTGTSLDELTEDEAVSLCVQAVKNENIIESVENVQEDSGIVITASEGSEGIEENIGCSDTVQINDEPTVTFAAVVEGIQSVSDSVVSLDGEKNLGNLDSTSISIPFVQDVNNSPNIVPFVVEDGVESAMESIMSSTQVVHCLGDSAIALPPGMQSLDGHTITITQGASGQGTITVTPNDTLKITEAHSLSEETNASHTIAISEDMTLTDGTSTYSLAGVLNTQTANTLAAIEGLNPESNNTGTLRINEALQINTSLSNQVLMESESDPVSAPQTDTGENLNLEQIVSVDEATNESMDAENQLNDDSAVDDSKSTDQQLEKDENERQYHDSDNNSNTVVIDISNPIQLCQNSLIVVNGQKCVLQQNPDTGQLFAYPIKEPEKPRKKRGRPRKVRADPGPEMMGDDESQSQDASFLKEIDCDPSEEEIEKGLVEKPNECGELVKRSMRKRKKAQSLNDYETGGLNLECSSEDEEEVDDDDEELPLKKRAGRGRGRPKKIMALSSSNSLLRNFPPGKRGRGRPRRYGVRPAQPQPQAFLIQLSDGQTIMVQVPQGNMPPDMTIQSIAQSIADSLQLPAQQQNKGPVAIAPRPPSDSPSTTTNSSGPVQVVLAVNSTSTDTTKEDSTNTTEAAEVSCNIEEVNENNDASNHEPSEVTPDNADVTHLETLASNSETSLAQESANEKSNGQVDVNNPTIIPLAQSVLPIILSKQETPIKIGLKASENDLEKLRCPKCDFQAYYQQQYQEHLSLHPDEVHRCKCCSYLALQEDELFAHYKENHPKCICSVCNHTAEHAYIIKRHMYRHSDTGCACEVCGKTYKDHYILKMHMKMVHMPAEILFECNVCGKKFTRKAHLKRHLRTHDPDKPYKCALCDYRGCEKSDITKHMLIHEDPKHTCEVCGKSFRHIKNKELHVKRHKGQRDYKCGVCDFYGYTFTDIRKHIERKHADARTIICQRCGQAFKTEALMKDHQHNGQCELFMLDQTFNDTEVASGLTQTINTETLQDSANVTTIALPDGSVTTLSDLAASGQIVLTDGKVHIPHSQIIDSNGQLTILTNSDGIAQVMVTDQGELNAEFALVAENGNENQVTMVTQDGAMLTEMIETGDQQIMEGTVDEFSAEDDSHDET